MNLQQTIHQYLERYLLSISSKHWIIVLTLISCVITLNVMLIQHGWITDDSVLYFEVAKQFLSGEFKAGLALYNWPLYPALIAGIQLLTGFTAALSAQALNVLFFAMTTFSFLSIVHLAGGNTRTIILAALMLFSSTYIVGDILPMLIRDQGFWAAYLTSLYFFIRYIRTPTFTLGLRWQCFAVIAILFRIEAITFFVLLPWMIYFTPSANKLRTWFHAQSIAILAVVGILAAIGLSASLSLHDFGRLNEVFTIFNKIYTNFTEVFTVKAGIIADQVMGSFLDEFGMLVLLSGLFSIYIYKCVLAGGWLAAGLVITKIKQAKSLIQPDTRLIFTVLIGIAGLNAVMILTNVFLLSGRYILSLGFILLILSAFCLESYLQQIKTKFDHGIIWLIFIVIFLSLVSNLLPKNPTHFYEQQAVSWAKQHTADPDKIFYVSPRARYYAAAAYQGRAKEWDFVKSAILDKSIYDYETLVINLNVTNHVKVQENWLLNHLTDYSLVHIEYGHKKKKRILIFKKNNFEQTDPK